MQGPGLHGRTGGRNGFVGILTPAPLFTGRSCNEAQDFLHLHGQLHSPRTDLQTITIHRLMGMASTTAHTHNVVEKSGVSAVNDRHRGSSNSSDHDLNGGKTEAEMTETPNEMYAIEAPENAADVEMDEQVRTAPALPVSAPSRADPDCASRS